MNTFHLSSSFKKNVIVAFGNTGKIWLEYLPTLTTECEKRFNIKIGKVFEHQSFNFTAEAVQANGTEVVIKLCVPTGEVDNEINALDIMRGNGIVQLLDADFKSGILLLERLNPGEMLTTIRDDIERTHIAAGVMQKIWKPISGSHSFPTTEKWFDRLNQSINLPTGFPEAFIDKAKNVAIELHQGVSETVLLHGDLHHFNILSANRQPWLAIDPKGVVGEREYEVGALLRNPIPDIATTMDTKRVLMRRLDLLADILAFDRKKLCSWSFAQAVLAAVWCLDGSDNSFQNFLACAKALDELL